MSEAEARLELESVAAEYQSFIKERAEAVSRLA
jgi:hypothetical protein